MPQGPSTSRELRVLSIAEALTVTGPIKPLLAFAAVVRRGIAGYSQVSQALVTTRRSGAAPEAAQDELGIAAREAGLEYIAIPEHRAYDLAVLPKMRRVIQQRRPHIVETHDCKSHFLFFAMRARYRQLREPAWVAFHHGYTRTSWRVSAYQQLDRLTLRGADRVLTLCKPFARTLVRRGVQPTRVSIIFNAIKDRPTPSREAVAETRAALGIAPHECVIGCVGRLSSEKGHGDLITAFKQVLDTERNCSLRLVIAGDGPEKARLKQLAEPLGNAVLFVGHIADPWPLYHAADIFALPSHSEGFPMVLLEAMAAGTPIVATAVGGVPESLTDGVTALLVPSRKPTALAAALATLVADAALRQRLSRAAAAALANFSPTAYAEKLVSIYESVIAGRSRTASWFSDLLPPA
jgi:glycosyltransferase involved in cell wall biosynthesis